jgi:hypothetical protein
MHLATLFANARSHTHRKPYTSFARCLREVHAVQTPLQLVRGAALPIAMSLTLAREVDQGFSI